MTTSAKHLVLNFPDGEIELHDACITYKKRGICIIVWRYSIFDCDLEKLERIKYGQIECGRSYRQHCEDSCICFKYPICGIVDFMH
jgi:hypothetical protein